MNPLAKKMLLAFVLAVALAFSLVGATYYFPSGQPSHSSSIPQTTAIPEAIPSTAPSTGEAVPAPTGVPMPAATTSESINLVPVLSIVAAIVIVTVAVWLLFSEKDLKL